MFIVVVGFATSMFYIINTNEVQLTKDAKRLDKEYKKATNPAIKANKKVDDDEEEEEENKLFPKKVTS